MKSEIYKNFEFLQLDSSSKCHYYLKKENKKSIILTIGYADFWYHTEITNYLIENNFNIYIIDVCNMGTAQTEEINNQIPSIEFACQELDKYFDSLKILKLIIKFIGYLILHLDYLQSDIIKLGNTVKI